MKGSEFKTLSQVIGLFASVRDKTAGSESVIGVQVNGGQAKMIAGKVPGAVVVTLPGEYEGKCSYIIAARPFLQAAKIITAKQEVEIEIDSQGITLTTGEGGKVRLNAEGELRDAGFPKKPKLFVVRSTVTGQQFSQLAKVFDAIVDDVEIEAPSLEQLDNVSHMVAVQPIKDKRAMYAHLAVDGERLEPEASGYHAAAYSLLWRSLKHFSDGGVIEWGDDGVLARSGPYELYCTPYRVTPYNPKTRTSEPARNPAPWPVMALQGAPSVSFGVEKKQLIEVIKGVMPGDEHNRVTMTVTDGKVNVAAFGTEGGMTIPASTLATGHRAVDATLLLKLMRAMDGKTITIAWAQQPSVILMSPEMVGWTILLAPVALS